MENDQNQQSRGTLASYVSGFALSLVLTLIAYALVREHVNSGHFAVAHEVLLPVIMALALVQLVVQLVFFLHLANERGPRWNLAILISTVSIIVIIMAGSLWIMGHLNYNMTPEQMNAYLLQQESFIR